MCVLCMHVYRCVCVCMSVPVKEVAGNKSVAL